jgi:ribosome maturation factor RimP
MTPTQEEHEKRKGTRHEELLGRLRELASDVAASHGVELVDLSLHGSSASRTLRVDIDRAGPLGVNLDDCQRVSGALGEALDADDLIEARYVLQVSSPGLDRPLRTADDFRRGTGRRLLVTMRVPSRGKASFRGVLLGSSEDSLRLVDDELGEVALALREVESVRQDAGF